MPDLSLTDLLAASGRDEAAADRLAARVYDELCRVARYTRSASDTLSTRGVVHEAYLKLMAGTPEQGWNGRAHFFGTAARAMRQVLVDRARARARACAKRGGGQRACALDDVPTVAEPSAEHAEHLLALNEALDRLAVVDPRAARVVECRYFAGLTVEETAEALSISTATVKRDWATARLWLYRELNGPSART